MKNSLFSYRYVLLMLTIRDIKLRYKQTALGIIWVILQPLLTALLLALLFGRSLKIPHVGNSYPLFAYSALIPWILFSQTLQRASASIVGDARLITKVYFPRLFLPLSTTLGMSLDYLITLGLGCLFALIGENKTTLHFLPLATFHLFLFCSAINILTAGISVYFRDLKHIIPFLIQLSMLISPIAYPVSIIPKKWMWLYQSNPLVGIIESYRHALLGAPLSGQTLAQSWILTLLFVAAALTFFQKYEHNLADIV